MSFFFFFPAPLPHGGREEANRRPNQPDPFASQQLVSALVARVVILLASGIFFTLFWCSVMLFWGVDWAGRDGFWEKGSRAF